MEKKWNGQEIFDHIAWRRRKFVRNPIDNDRKGESDLIPMIYIYFLMILFEKRKDALWQYSSSFMPLLSSSFLFHFFLSFSLSLFFSLPINDRLDRWLVLLPPLFTKPNNNNQCSLSLVFASHQWLWWKVTELWTCFVRNNPSPWLTTKIIKNIYPVDIFIWLSIFVIDDLTSFFFTARLKFY